MTDNTHAVDQESVSATADHDYAARVNAALHDPRDPWGRKLVADADGPTYAAVAPLLVPVAIAGGSLTDSGYYYLAFCHPVPSSTSDLEERHFALHVADGSQVIADWARLDDISGELTRVFHNRRHNAHRRGPLRSVTILVGASAEERFGEDLNRLTQPDLADGHLPVLRTSYRDRDNVTWEHESFVRGVPNSASLVSHLRWVATTTAGNTLTRLRLRVDAISVDDAEMVDATLLVAGSPLMHLHIPESAELAWSAPDLVVTMPVAAGHAARVHATIVTGPLPNDLPEPRPAVHAATRKEVTQYWRSLLAEGTDIQVPEKLVIDAMRSVLVQQLAAGWRVAIGNAYEQLYIPECTQALLPLAQFGFLARHRDNLQELLDATKGSDLYPNWEMGCKLEHTAIHYWLSRDRGIVSDNLPMFMGALERMRRHRSRDPHGLLPPEWHSEDINEYIYGVHHQSVVWRGLRDYAAVLRHVGRDADATQFDREAVDLHTALVNALARSVVKLEDGSLFVPLQLLGDETPYDPITESRAGSYWNIMVPWALATGILPPGSDMAAAALQYLRDHGGTFLGLTRFNYYGLPIGECKPDGYEGYRSTGIDQQFGHAYLTFLADNDQPDQIVLALYAKLAHDMTRGTYVSGEGSTISPCADLDGPFRTFWNPPLGSNGATYLHALRLGLVHEQFGRDGTPRQLTLLPATPRRWLRPGQHLSFHNLPTAFGPVSVDITVGDNGELIGELILSAVEPRPEKVRLRLRLPADYKLDSITVDGTVCPIDAATETSVLPGSAGRFTIRAQMRHRSTHLTQAQSESE